MTADDLFVPLTPPTPTGAKPRPHRHDWSTEGLPGWTCTRCGKVRDEAAARRNRRNRQNGGANERRIAKRHGGRRTGPLGGRDDVMTDSMFAVQAKRSLRFSLGEARTYLADLSRIYPTRVAYVTHHFPGERDGVVILRESDWLALHGPTREEP